MSSNEAQVEEFELELLDEFELELLDEFELELLDEFELELLDEFELELLERLELELLEEFEFELLERLELELLEEFELELPDELKLELLERFELECRLERDFRPLLFRFELGLARFFLATCATSTSGGVLPRAAWLTLGSSGLGPASRAGGAAAATLASPAAPTPAAV